VTSRARTRIAAAIALVAVAVVASAEDRGSLPLDGAAIDTRAFRYSRAIPDGPPGLTSFVLDAAALAHSHGFADVRIVDSHGRQVPWLREELDEPLEIPLAPFELVETRTERGRNTTRYTVTLPHAGLPTATLVLATTERVFDRTVTMKAAPLHRWRRRSSRHGIVEVRRWQHADPETPAGVARLEVPPLASEVVEILIEEGENERLRLSAPTLLLPSHRIRFVREHDAGSLRLVYGNDRAAAPRYDLALLGREFLDAPAAEVALEAEAPNETRGGTVPERRVFWGALLASVLAVLVLIGRLVTRQP
jgi:hypothetical protein